MWLEDSKHIHQTSHKEQEEHESVPQNGRPNKRSNLQFFNSKIERLQSADSYNSNHWQSEAGSNSDIWTPEIPFEHLNSNVQDFNGDQDDNSAPNISQSMTTMATVEQTENIIDQCIEIESNERIRKEHVNKWTLRFKDPDLEFKFCQLREDMFKSNIVCCFIVWGFIVMCQMLMLPKSFVVTTSLILTTLILSCTLTLAMAEEFQMLPKIVQKISSILVQNRTFRTSFICGVMALMCFASSLSLILNPQSYKVSRNRDEKQSSTQNVSTSSQAQAIYLSTKSANISPLTSVGSKHRSYRSTRIRHGIIEDKGNGASVNSAAQNMQAKKEFLRVSEDSKLHFDLEELLKIRKILTALKNDTSELQFKDLKLRHRVRRASIDTEEALATSFPSQSSPRNKRSTSLESAMGSVVEAPRAGTIDNQGINEIDKNLLAERFIVHPNMNKLCLHPEYLVYTWVLSLIALATTLKLYFLVKSMLAMMMVIAYASCILIFYPDVFAHDKLSYRHVEVPMRYQMLLLLLTFLILVAYHARLVEVTSRLDFLWKRDAERELAEMREIRKNNRQLLRNILPDHVAHHFLVEDRQTEELYSQSRDNVGVMFASIPNFTEFYSEDINKGVECIRLLNEIIVDFDELLGESRFNSIEKIKTIGASYMVASGLNPAQKEEKDQYAHICALVDFALAMKSCLEELNKHSFNNFQLRVGISSGALVGGVIGARKPVFDVWGNTVNEASRMDSTGKMGLIQVPKHTAEILAARGYRVEYRGQVAVKGKGDMETYYVSGRDGALFGFVRQPSQHNSLAAVVFGMVQSRKRRQSAKRHTTTTCHTSMKNRNGRSNNEVLSRAKSDHAQHSRSQNCDLGNEHLPIVNFSSFRLSKRSFRANANSRRVGTFRSRLLQRGSPRTPQASAYTSIQTSTATNPSAMNQLSDDLNYNASYSLKFDNDV